MASLTASISQGCDATGGVLTLTQADPAPGAPPDLAFSWTILNPQNVDYGGTFDPAFLPVSVGGLPNDTYRIRVSATDTDGSSYRSQVFTRTVTCSTGPVAPGQLVLDSLSHTDETQAGADGTATIQASGGTAPLTAELVELSLSQPATSGQPTTFGPVPSSTYTLRVTDSTTPTAQVVSGQVTIAPYVAPVAGCLDEYADNYDPAATSSNNSCTYTPLWRSAWQPMAVRVAAVAGQVDGFISANLRIGFRPGHPLAADRPLGTPLALGATVAPDGYATFVLGPYLRPQLGAPDGAGGYRLDLNSTTAFDADLYVGYELRRPDGTLLEHGYALNAAVPDALIAPLVDVNGNPLPLSPFTVLLGTPAATLPVWPGFADYQVACKAPSGMAFSIVRKDIAPVFDTITLPCPLNPLPIAWLAPGSGYGFWVFQGKPTLGDNVGDGQPYREASSGQQRLSDPGEAYQTYKASSGVFKGDALLTGLRTLWRSPQAWVQLGGVWVPIVVERGSRDVGRLGVAKNEVPISFQLAAPEWAQGQ